MTGTCDVCIEQDSDCDAEVFLGRECVARKPSAKCCECGDPLFGVRHELVTGKWDGEWQTYRTCLSCVEIRKMATCGGVWVYTMLWEDIREQMFPHGTLAGCLSRLESAAAKAKLSEMWRGWKGLDGPGGAE